jgi:hypothetical protein
MHMPPEPTYCVGTSVRASSLGPRHWIAGRPASAVSTIATIAIARICAAQPACTARPALHANANANANTNTNAHANANTNTNANANANINANANAK